MNNLIQWLSNVKHKTGLIAILLGVLVTLQGIAIDVHTMLWMDTIAGALLLLFRAIAPTGEFPKGWTLWFWIANAVPVVLQIATLLSGSTLFGPEGIVVLAKIQMYLAAAFAGVSIYWSSKQSS